MNGTHRGNGIWIAQTREGVTPAAPPVRLATVAPWLAQTMGLAWDEAAAGDHADATGPRQAYQPDEEDMVAERLRALGYLD